MTIKHPSGRLAAPGSSDSGEETIDDSLEEILLEANEKPLENPIRPGQSVPQLQLPQPGSAGPLSMTVTPLPLPGIAPPPVLTPLPASASFTPEHTPAPTPPPVLPRDEATQVTRPSVLDEVGEESTNVEPLETARLAAATKDDEPDDLALSDQASAEREKALRRLTPPLQPPVARASESEFEDPDDGDYPGPPLADAMASDTPGAIAIDDDDDDESTANGRPLGSSRPISTPALGARLPPPGVPFGRPESLGAVRLPTPSGGFPPPAPSPPFGVASGHSAGVPMPSPGFSPPVGSSPFGNARSSTPAIPIPAPSGVPASPTHSPLFRKVPVPLGALVAFAVAFFSLGVVATAFWMRLTGEPEMAAAPGAASAPVATSPTPSSARAPSVTAPAAPPAAVAVPVPATPPAPPPPPTAAIKEAAAPEQEEAADEAPPSRPAPARPVRRAAPTPVATAKPSRPRKSATAAKEADGRGVAKGWVDPFAQ